GVDASGNTCLTGRTTSTVDFPTTAGAFQTLASPGGGGREAFVLKVNPTGTAYVYGTLIKGNLDDNGLAIAIDAAGNAYVTGQTQSTNLPTTAGAFQTTFINTAAQPIEAFLAKVNTAGTGVAYLSY